MRIRVAPRPDGVPADAGAPALPGSKSHAQRALCLARFLPHRVVFEGIPESGDVTTLRAALAARAGATRDLRDNGTGLRILAVLLPMLGERATLDAGPRLRERPLAAAVGFLERYGARVGDGWPRSFDGAGVEWPGDLEVDARLTSQVATGVLLGCGLRLARHGERRCVRVIAPSAPDYLLVTLEVLKWFGCTVGFWWDGEDLLCDFQEFAGWEDERVVHIPVDPSSYVFYAAFQAVHGLDVARYGIDHDPHPDWLFADDLQRLLDAEAGVPLRFAEIRRRPDTFPCLAVLAALRVGRTAFVGIPALRHKESDRIAAMAALLTALGVRCEERPDGLEVEGPLPAHDAPVRVPTPDDHRIVMAAALLGTRIPGGLEIDNPECVAKSWPGYFDWLGRVSSVEGVEL